MVHHYRAAGEHGVPVVKYRAILDFYDLPAPPVDAPGGQ